jgi:hypothetical protein
MNQQEAIQEIAKAIAVPEGINWTDWQDWRLETVCELAVLGEIVASLRAELDQLRAELAEARAEITRMRLVNGLREVER